MKFVTKNKTNQLLCEVMKGEPLIISYRGKPAACLLPLTADDLEDFIIEHSPQSGKKIAQAEKDIREGRLVSLDDYLERLEAGSR